MTVEEEEVDTCKASTPSSAAANAWGFRYGRNLRMRITVKLDFRNNAMTNVLIKPHFSWRLSSQISFGTQQGNFMMRSSKMRSNARFGMEQRR